MPRRFRPLHHLNADDALDLTARVENPDLRNDFVRHPMSYHAFKGDLQDGIFASRTASPAFSADADIPMIKYLGEYLLDILIALALLFPLVIVIAYHPIGHFLHRVLVV
jgi:hypothetical protein